MTGLVLTDEEVKPELQVVLEERNMRVANNPGARLGEQMEAALYLNHPYGKPIIGWRHEIESLTRDDVLEFYGRFYTPNNAVLVVAGDVAVEEVEALAQETYGKVRRVTDIRPRLRPGEPAQEAPRTVTLADPRVAQPSVSRYYLAPSLTTAQTGEGEALEGSLTFWVVARTTGSIGRWWSTRASRWTPVQTIRERRSTTGDLASSEHLRPASRWRKSKRRSMP